jgi:hypothetical protein
MLILYYPSTPSIFKYHPNVPNIFKVDINTTTVFKAFLRPILYLHQHPKWPIRLFVTKIIPGFFYFLSCILTHVSRLVILSNLVAKHYLQRVRIVKFIINQIFNFRFSSPCILLVFCSKSLFPLSKCQTNCHTQITKEFKRCVFMS